VFMGSARLLSEAPRWRRRRGGRPTGQGDRGSADGAAARWPTMKQRANWRALTEWSKNLGREERRFVVHRRRSRHHGGGETAGASEARGVNVGAHDLDTG